MRKFSFELFLPLNISKKSNNYTPQNLNFAGGRKNTPQNNGISMKQAARKVIANNRNQQQSQRRIQQTTPTPPRSKQNNNQQQQLNGGPPQLIQNGVIPRLANGFVPNRSNKIAPNNTIANNRNKQIVATVTGADSLRRMNSEVDNGPPTSLHI